MHKGNKTFTTYNFNEDKEGEITDRMMDYFSEVPEAMEEDWKVGHIHSHNNMSVFFSGTDMEELEENSRAHNFYLSLIVNNDTNLCAKVATRAYAEKEVEVDYNALDEFGKSYRVRSKKLSVKDSFMVTYDCDIQVPEVVAEPFDKMFLENVKSITKEEDKKYYSKTSSSSFINPWKGGVKKSTLRNPPAPQYKRDSQISKWNDRLLFDDDDDLLHTAENSEEVLAFLVGLITGDDGCQVDSLEDIFNPMLLASDWMHKPFTTGEIVGYLPELFEDYFMDLDNDEIQLVLMECISELKKVVKVGGELVEVLIKTFESILKTFSHE